MHAICVVSDGEPGPDTSVEKKTLSQLFELKVSRCGM